MTFEDVSFIRRSQRVDPLLCRTAIGQLAVTHPLRSEARSLPFARPALLIFESVTAA
jgi:hypothetical protein